jgi:hypothetical protein
MSKVKNLVITFDNQESLMKMKEDYEFIGREVDVDMSELKLTVLTLPRKYKKKNIREAKIARKREAENEYDFDAYDRKYNN